MVSYTLQHIILCNLSYHSALEAWKALIENDAEKIGNLNGINGFCVAHYPNAHYLILRTNSFAALPGRVTYSDYLIWHGEESIADCSVSNDARASNKGHGKENMVDKSLGTFWFGETGTVTVTFKVSLNQEQPSYLRPVRGRLVPAFGDMYFNQ